MSAFLEYTDPDDDTPVYVRASRVEAVVAIPKDDKAGPFGIHPHEHEGDGGYTKLVLSGGVYVRVAEPVEEVAADLNRTGR